MKATLALPLLAVAAPGPEDSVLGPKAEAAAHLEFMARNGAEHGHEWLLESNLDWGQDLLAFREWLRTNPEARPKILAYRGGIHPRLLGVDLPPPVIEGVSHAPGWHAISANFVMGMTAGTADDAGGWTRVAPDAFSKLRGLTPQARTGKSIWVYRRQ